MTITAMNNLTPDGFGICVLRPFSNVSSMTVFQAPSSVAIENPFQEGAIHVVDADAGIPIIIGAEGTVGIQPCLSGDDAADINADDIDIQMTLRCC